MDWTLYLGVAGAIALVRWEKNELKLLPFIIDVIASWVTLFLLLLITDFVVTIFNISLPGLPEKLEIWIGSIILFIVACIISFKGWGNGGFKKEVRE